MKHIYIVLLLVGTNLISAQDTRLFENTWYLSKIVSNGIDYLPPNNTEVSSIGLTFNQQENTFNTNYCNSIFGGVIFGNNLTEFSLNGYAVTLRMCNSQSDNSYENLYINFFIGNNPNNYFSYAILENGTVKTLTINSANNKQAIYSSQNLAINSFKEIDYSVYHDSSSAVLIVELKNQYTENIKVELFDSLGKTCKKESFSTAQIKISTADLTTGIYVVKITADNRIAVKKFIKP